MKLRNLTLATTVILLPSPAYAQYFECETCPAGTWNNGNYESCQKCAAGTYSTGGVSSCTNCPAGKYSTGGASSCTNCPAGKYSTGGASSCTNCPAGKYSTGGASSCTNCLTTGVASCSATTGKATSCKGGFGLLSSACLQCSAGTYSPGGTTVGCYSCSSGYYSNAGASSCTKCPAGTYSGAKAKSCTSCSAGTYSTGGASSCTNCLTTGVATCDSTTGKATSCIGGFKYDSQKNVCNITCSAQGFLNATGVGESCQCEVIKTSDVITKIHNNYFKSYRECSEACSKSCGLSSEIATCYGNCNDYFPSQNVGYHYCCKTTKPSSCNCSCPPNSSGCGCADTCQRIYDEWRNGCFYTSNSCSGDHPAEVKSIQ